MDEIINRYLKNPVFALIAIGLAGFLIRAYYFPQDIPIILDGYAYFWYAVDMSLLGTFPTGYTFPNNGWPSLLSFLFVIFHQGSFLDYMALQRVFSVVISVLTVIPVYFLCSQFFEKRYALLGSSLFVLDPRIIQNSLLGITDPLFIILVFLSLFLFLHKNERCTFFAFGVAALASIVRYEGLLIIVPYSVLFFMRFKISRKTVIKYVACVVIFAFILLPMAQIRIETTGSDGFVSHVAAGPQHVISRHTVYNENALDLLNFVVFGFLNLIKYLGWVMIPTFVSFVFFGVWYFLKNKEFKNKTLIATFIILVLPAYYAYARGIEEPRYLLVILPILCVISLYAVKRLGEKVGSPNIVVVLLFIGIISSSLLFLELKKDDLDHRREAFLLTTKIDFSISGINEFYPESEFLKLMPIYDAPFPNLKKTYEPEPRLIVASDFDSMNDFIEYGREHGLTHVATDGGFDTYSRSAVFLIELFEHENQYTYLTKVFDSEDYGVKYRLKIFKINYDEFDSIQLERQ